MADPGAHVVGVRMSGEPRVAFQEAVDGFEIRDLTVSLPRAGLG